MARTLNPVAHAARRDAFVEAAMRLIASKGYEQLSIQDVLDEVGSSKGAFYHYFNSKAALLAAVVEHSVDAAAASLVPIVADPNLSPLQKIQAMFSGIAQWKGERTELMLEIGRVWLSDDNAVVRERLRSATATRLTPLLTTIIRRGTEEGVFTASPAEGVANVFVALMLGLNEAAGQLSLARQAGVVSFEDVERTLTAYGEAFERVLGLPAGSWPAADKATLHRWFD
jgi:AcrR family transcriptional regulator